MTRTKDSYYFSHDSDARNDIKMMKLRRQLGLEGYGLFWCLIEMLRATPDYRLPLSSADDIAYEINISKEKVEAVINGYGLFRIDQDHFFSERLCRAMGMYNDQKSKLSDAGRRGMQKRWNGSEPKAPPLTRLE